MKYTKLAELCLNHANAINVDVMLVVLHTNTLIQLKESNMILGCDCGCGGDHYDADDIAYSVPIDQLVLHNILDLDE